MPYLSTAERFSKEEGIKEGIKKEKYIVATRLLSTGAKLAFVKEITGLSLAKIKAIQSKDKKH